MVECVQQTLMKAFIVLLAFVILVCLTVGAAENSKSKRFDKIQINIYESIKDHPCLLFSQDVLVNIEGESFQMNYLTMLSTTTPEVLKKFTDLGYQVAKDKQREAFILALAQYHISETRITDRIRQVGRINKTNISVVAVVRKIQTKS